MECHLDKLLRWRNFLISHRNTIAFNANKLLFNEFDFYKQVLQHHCISPRSFYSFKQVQAAILIPNFHIKNCVVSGGCHVSFVLEWQMATQIISLQCPRIDYWECWMECPCLQMTLKTSSVENDGSVTTVDSIWMDGCIDQNILPYWKKGPREKFPVGGCSWLPLKRWNVLSSGALHLFQVYRCRFRVSHMKITFYRCR